MCTRVLMLIHNDIFHEGLEFIYLTAVEDPLVGLFPIFSCKFIQFILILCSVLI